VKCEVRLTQVGLNPSSVVTAGAGQQVGHGNTVTIGHRDTVQFLSGQLDHMVLFNPPPTAYQEEKRTGLLNKRKSEELEQEADLMSKKRRLEDPLPQEEEAACSVTAPWLDCGPGRLLKAEAGAEWRELAGGKLIVRSETSPPTSARVAAFDIDGTIICTKSGRVFPIDENDWQLLSAAVPVKLKQLLVDGYRLVLVTNQAGIATGKTTVEKFQTKMNNLLARLGVKADIYCSASDTGYYRKPRPGMWESLEAAARRAGCPVQRSASFYCGDAAGRQAGWLQGKKKDFSCSDRLFALNLDLAFHTPEEFFYDHKASKLFTTPFHPSQVKAEQQLEPAGSELVPSHQFLALLVGIQGSGKSNLSKQMQAQRSGVVVASNDATGGKEKTLRLVDKALGEGRSVVVDNTHVDREARRAYLQCGARHGVVVRAVLLTTSHDHARHNNCFREIVEPSHARIKEMLLNQYRSKFQPPSPEEGFSEIIKVNFIPYFEKEEELKRLYNMHLLDK